MYEILTGKQRALVFPIMCNGHIKIDYRDNVADTSGDLDAADDIAFGIWDHEGSFTFEGIITPYDINGFGTQSEAAKRTFTTTKKIMPALAQTIYDSPDTSSNYQSELYLDRTARLTHEMMVFYSSDFQISLVNVTTHNENQPAQYKIRVRLKLGSTTETFDSSPIIIPSESRAWHYSENADLNGIDVSGRLTYDRVGWVEVHSGTSLTVRDNSNNPVGTVYFDGGLQEVFIEGEGFDFISLGTIASKAGNVLTLTDSYSPTLIYGTYLYLPTYKAPTYINNTFHIACSYNDVTKTVKIYYDGILVKEANHTQTDEFNFDKEDFYLGANGAASDGAGSATTNKQFMGEFHEISLISNTKSNFISTFNLLPNYNDTLLYLKFEEVDIW